ncbi:MAG: gliding motility-associated C-terminal domain-containing protein, partial [Schleiferiaceae bacterium]|nr:gliding motility-associated C-terminal domain-containing protein [Schleiferiaceae bacterium]
VYAREQINFDITSFDLDFKPNCTPDNIEFVAAGGNLSDAANWGNPNSCKFNAPCATITSLNGNPPGSGGFISPSSNNVAFQWQTDCPHLTYQQYQCGTFKSVYEFYFRMQDDACPTPGFSYGTYKVNVLNYPPIPPDMQNSCVGLDQATGDLTFDWVAPVDTGINFDYYVIYHSTNPNGPFIAIDTIYDYNITTYVHAAQGGANSNFYFMRTAGGCSLISDPSDTTALVEMTLTPVPPVNSSSAVLNWTPHNSKPSSTIYYQIWRRVWPNGTWAMIDSTTNLTYTDLVDICSADLEYEIRIKGKCFSTSDHAIFSDQSNSDTIVVDSVTVMGNQAVMHWQPTTMGDATDYLVMWFDPALNAYVAVDTVPVGTPMPYTWNASTAGSRAEEFVIVSIDSCGNQSSELNAEPMKTMYLDVTTNACEGFTRLRWNDYKTFGGVQYDVLVDIKDDQGNQIATGALLSANGSNLTYKHTTLISGYEYCYYIRATDSTGLRTSTSNVVCISSLVVKKSRLLYLASTNVRNNGSIEVYSFIDPDADVISYSIERSVSKLGPYLTVGTVPKPSTGPAVVEFSDYSALASENRYYYRISATDSCGAQDTVSNIGTNVLLEVTRNGNLTNTLVWNKYEEYGGIVGRYEVYRMVDDNGAWELVTDQLTENDTVYEDNIRDYAEGQGKFCYFVVAVEANNPLNFVDENGNAFSSRSNTACVVHEARMFIPSAFNPDSDIEENRVWMPQNIFAQEGSYQLEVYNRWGARVFSTANMNEGWDGMLNGGQAPMGVYSYVLKYKSLNGIPKEERGTFTLYRNKAN